MIITTKDTAPVYHRDNCICKSKGCKKRRIQEFDITDSNPQWQCIYCMTVQPWKKSAEYKRRVTI
jgi:hypothetical protein